jgi:hypothetical protein
MAFAATNSFGSCDLTSCAFSIIKSPNPQHEKQVVVTSGEVISLVDGSSKHATGTDKNPEDGRKFNWGDDIYLNISVSDSGAITSAVVSSSSSGDTYLKVGSVGSENGFITQQLNGCDGVFVAKCGNVVLYS